MKMTIFPHIWGHYHAKLGIAGKLNFSKNLIFSFGCFRLFQTDFLPDFFTYKFGVTFSHFLTLPKV